MIENLLRNTKTSLDNLITNMRPYFKNILAKTKTYFNDLLTITRPYLKNLIKIVKELPKPDFRKLTVKAVNFRLKKQRNSVDETPNLKYIIQLSNSDIDFHNQFLRTLSEEYDSDLRAYLLCIEMEAPRAAAAKVSKLKDKLHILGMKNAFRFAERHQRKLQKGNKSSDRKFKKILAKTNRFLENQLQVYQLIN